MSNIDPRTGRPFGDHGTGEQAIEFALTLGPMEVRSFLEGWQMGDLDEWPEFYRFLADGDE